MKTLIKSSVILSCFLTMLALAESPIKKVDISYSRLLMPVDRNGFSIPQAIVGGKVDFQGTAPAYVTMLIGGQAYTQPTDRMGYFSFLVYTNGAGEYRLEAWMPQADAVEGGLNSAPFSVVQSLK